MILNVYTVIVLFIDAISFALAATLLIGAVRQMRRARRTAETDGIERFENVSTLVLLTAAVLACLRLLSWPLLYAALQSYVASVEGAMCIYGVTCVAPELARACQALKPAAGFAAGAWLLFDHADRAPGGGRFASIKARAFVWGSLLILVEIVLEAALIMTIHPTVVVTCCTTVADVASRPTSVVPTRLLGDAYAGPLTAVFLVLCGAVAAISALGAREKDPSKKASVLLGAAAAGSALALALAPVFAAEVLGPAWLGLPFHHCVYCFVAFRDAPVASGLFILGVFLVLWAALLHVACGMVRARAATWPTTRTCLAWAGFCLAGSIGMCMIHLWHLRGA